MEGEPRARCDACGHDLEQESPVIYDCFHALHVACAYGNEACCPLCRAPCTTTTTRLAAPGANSSVAGGMRSNADAGETSTRPALCDVCGGELDPREVPFVSPDCDHALHLGCSYSAGGACPCCPAPSRRPLGAESSPDTPPISPWCSSCYSLDDFGSPGLSQTPSHADMFDENPPATDSPYTPRQPSYTGPFAQQPPPPANTSEPPPAQYGPPPSYYQQYSHAGVFGQPPPAAPHTFASPQPPQAEAGQQFGCPPSSQPSRNALFQQMPPPPAFERPYNSNFRPVGPPPLPAPSHPFHGSLLRPTAVYSSGSFQPLQPPPSHALFPAGYLPVCAFCGGAMCRGQTTVASQCNHTFHFRCFAGMFCPVCGAQWSDVAVPVIPPPPPPFKSWW